ncbi:branched-chain amino acid transport system permease protein [Azospirillum lipoferum]|uniref:Branched-chain amino acid ABC transporter permease n=1 Tax=Azospirillum lipoferum TaxID=193 RepID=A0A5A9GQA1_AZOLI|nr:MULTISPECIES: branched-chain amino acid ABC transporter permease [Azospirillum]KAA0596656.1 branched-chain amino acid ABC transporter permease [Azospirillum lipoferum]MCP1610672.1 branched-chain amino acid transport system permease protein [Azospirillum lipoferum]MDW5537884.1 branched-chain amino acid ABC transporter permease [Azospirillum sp. NL1]
MTSVAARDGKAGQMTRPAPLGRRRDLGWIGIPLVAVAGLAAYWLLPDDLALLTRIAASALFVLSLDLVLGYGGIATLGQAAMFGTGAYAAGIVAVNWNSDPFVMLAAGGLAGGLIALVTGALILHARGLTLLMLTIAVGQIVQEVANKARDWTGGSDGLSGIDPAPVLGLFRFDMFGRTSYLFALAVLVVGLVVARRIVRSPFGLACRGVKEDPLRISAIGGSPKSYLVALYGVAGVFAGVAGALTAVTSGIVGLDSAGFPWSAEALVMLVLGGTGRLYGAVIGTAAFMGIHHVLAASDPFHWMGFIGLFLIGIVLFLPGGIASGLERLGGLFRGKEDRA